MGAAPPARAPRSSPRRGPSPRRKPAPSPRALAKNRLMDLASFRKKCVLWGVVAFLLSGAFANALATEY